MPQPGRQRIFISYRRSDSAGYSGRLRDALKRLLRVPVFMDVADIAPGDKFRDTLAEELRSCGATLAIIGPQWLAALSAPRQGEDFVRIELTQALREDDVVVFPILIQGASLPAAASLPDDLKALAERQAFSLRDDRWDADVKHLAVRLRQVLGLRVIPGWVFAAAGLLLAGIAYAVLSVPPDPTPYDRDRALNIIVPAMTQAAGDCEKPEGAKGSCPIRFLFRPDGVVDEINFDTGWCEYKGTPFGDCVLDELKEIQLPPFNDKPAVELGFDLKIEADGGVQVTPY